jgi:hypothetical protein
MHTNSRSNFLALKWLLLAVGVSGFALTRAAAQPPAGVSATTNGEVPAPDILRGAGERTPSRSEYFTWINHYDNGPTAPQTMANLAFFKKLHEDYGMVLDIYAFDVGALDGGTPTLEQRLVPSTELKHIAASAATMQTRLGVWTGADGYGDTPQQEAARREIFVALCRDLNFALFKFDSYSIAGPRPEKLPCLARTLSECRSFTPDLICLNHRQELGPAAPLMTTTLWEGAETYVDVHSSNPCTAPHHRAGVLSRGVPPNLTRLVEDHGVCFSSCLDYWEDDVVLQAFNRSLILAPEIYANPWLLNDAEFPLLARLFNLHRRYNRILVDGMVLPEPVYGSHAVSRGDGQTRFLTMRNLSWTSATRLVKCDASIGLVDNGQPVEIRQIHPTEKILGQIKFGGQIPVDVPSFRASLLLISNEKIGEIGLAGCNYQIVRDVPGKPVTIKLLGMPGSTAEHVRLSGGARKFSRATLDGAAIDAFAGGGTLAIQFSGNELKEACQRKLGELQPTPVPADAEALYEATVFAADNNALEARSLLRSGPTNIPEVAAARQAFFEQPLFVTQGAWDRYAFDSNPETSFRCRKLKYPVNPINGGVFRLDLGKPELMDRMVLTGRDFPAALVVEVSEDLSSWTTIQPQQDATALTLTPPPDKPLRYVRITPTLANGVAEVMAYRNGQPLANRSAWRASNLFGPYAAAPARFAWSCAFKLDELAPKSYLAIAIPGVHGAEGAYAAIRVNGRPVGAPDRAQSYLSNGWEGLVGFTGGLSNQNYTYYIPLTPDMVGKPIEAVVLQLGGTAAQQAKIAPEVWITAYPAPFVAREMVLW